MKRLPLEFGISVRGPKCLNDRATRGRKSFKIGSVVLIQYRLWQADTQPASQTRCRSKDYAICYRVAHVKTPIFAPTSGARSSISPKLCMLIENVVTILKGANLFFDPTHSFSYRGENADFWPLTHWINLIPAGCHGNLPVIKHIGL